MLPLLALAICCDASLDYSISIPGCKGYQYVCMVEPLPFHISNTVSHAISPQPQLGRGCFLDYKWWYICTISFEHFLILNTSRHISENKSESAPSPPSQYFPTRCTQLLECLHAYSPKDHNSPVNSYIRSSY